MHMVSARAVGDVWPRRLLHAYIQPSARVRWAFPTVCYVPGRYRGAASLSLARRGAFAAAQAAGFEECSARYDTGRLATAALQRPGKEICKRGKLLARKMPARVPCRPPASRFKGNWRKSVGSLRVRNGAGEGRQASIGSTHSNGLDTQPLGTCRICKTAI